MLNVHGFNALNTTKKANFQQNSAQFSSRNLSMQKSDNDSFTSSNNSHKDPSFGTLLRITGSGRKIDTAFFRGLETIKAAANYLDKLTGNNLVLHYAGSIGEEAYTNRMILKNPNCKVVSLDIDSEAVDLARKGLHSVFAGFADSFLLRPDYLLSEEQKGFKTIFNKIFSPAQKPDFVLNNKFVNDPIRPVTNWGEHFYTVNDNARNFVDFPDVSMGNILAHGPVTSEKPKAIYARNFLYQLTGNNIHKVMTGSEEPAQLNLKVLDDVANEMYEKLDDKGLFVVGDFIAEHFFLAPEKKYGNLKMNQTALYRGMEYSSQLNVRDFELFKTSPLQSALQKDNKFKAIYWDELDDFPSIKVPTIWQKN